MSDETNPRDERPREQENENEQPAQQAAPPADTPENASGAKGRSGPRRLRGRAAIAAAAVGLLLVGGFGGFALGHATGGDGERAEGFPGRVHGFDGDRGGPPGFRGPGAGIPQERGYHHHDEGDN